MLLRRFAILVGALLVPVALALCSQALVDTQAPPRLPHSPITVEFRPPPTPEPSASAGVTVGPLPTPAPQEPAPTPLASPRVSEVPPAPEPINPTTDPEDEDN